MQDAAVDKSRRIWARVAGAVYIALIALFMGADQAAHAIVGSGGFAQIAARLAPVLPLYRSVLAINVAGVALTLVLAVALYEAVKPANPALARLALLFRMAEGFLEAFTCTAAFAIVRLYAAPLAGFDLQQMQGLVSLLRALQGGMFNIVTMLFGIGSILFFWIFITSRCIPRLLSVFGFLASLLVPVIGLAGLIVPDHAKELAPAWYPMMIAELTTGAWLLVFAIKTASSAKE
jgi:hypothetical protein